MSTGATSATPYADRPGASARPAPPQGARGPHAQPAPPEAPPATPPEALPPVVARGVEAARAMPRSDFGVILLRALVGMARFAFAALFCQTMFGAMIVVGWITRRMQRATFKHWFRRSPVRAQGVSFEQFTLADSSTAYLAHAPNGLLQQRFFASLRDASKQPTDNARLGGVCVALGHSLWRNIRLGFQAISATWLVTLPCFGLLALAWLSGWNISFNKLYEQAWIGATTGLSAIALVSIVMMFVPWAQARHAATGEWRAFFQFSLIAKLTRRYWYLTIVMSLLYLLASLPIAIIQARITGFGNEPQFDGVPDTTVLAALNQYFYVVTFFLVLPMFMALRWVSAKFYAFAMLREVRLGRVLPGDLGDAERQMLVRLGHVDAGVDHLPDAPKPPTVTGAMAATVRGGFRALAWFGLGLTSFLIWFGVMFQMLTAQFFNFQPVVGWINHALVHLPWVRFIPEHMAGR